MVNENKHPLPIDAPPSKGPERVPAFEKHYSVKELAILWNVSDRTIRRMFAAEPGVVEWGADESRSKRSYKTLRIPEVWRNAYTEG